MHRSRPLAFILLLACAPILGACSPGNSGSDGIASAVSHSVSNALDKAQAKLRDAPIEVSHNDPTLPKAEITPKGDFIVGGKTVAITPTQRAALLDYRKQLLDIATQGIAIGKQGTALGMQAASAAIAGVFSGKSDREIEQSVNAKTAGIRQAVAKICDRLPAMMAGQQNLAAVLPAFKPYATMTREDIRDCRDDALHDDDSHSDQTRAAIRERIRQRIRTGIKTTAHAAGVASRGTSDDRPATAGRVTQH